MKENNLNEIVEQLLHPMIEKVVSEVLEERTETSAPVKDPEDFLTIGKAAKEFGCTTHLLQKAINNLELDYYKPENRTYVKRKDVYNYLESIRIRSKENSDGYDFSV